MTNVTQNYRVNVRFNLENPDDIKALETLRRIAADENCSFSRAVINTVNRFSACNESDYADILAEKIADHLKNYSFVSETNSTVDDCDKETDDLIFEFMQCFN